MKTEPLSGITKWHFRHKGGMMWTALSASAEVIGHVKLDCRTGFSPLCREPPRIQLCCHRHFRRRVPEKLLQSLQYARMLCCAPCFAHRATRCNRLIPYQPAYVKAREGTLKKIFQANITFLALEQQQQSYEGTSFVVEA